MNRFIEEKTGSKREECRQWGGEEGGRMSKNSRRRNPGLERQEQVKEDEKRQ